MSGEKTGKYIIAIFSKPILFKKGKFEIKVHLVFMI